MFNPVNIAIIGASSREGSLGRGLAENVLESFRGRVYLVNKRGGELHGLKMYREISEIPDQIDLALIIVPAESVPETIEQLGEKKTKIAVVYSGGFREAGRKDLEERLIDTAKRYGIRILGPNCVGFIDSWTPINATFISRERQGIPEKGFISIISQSGALGSLFLDLLSYRRIGLRRFVSIGNASDIDLSEMLEYLSHDPYTRVLGIYIENIGEGRRLVDIIRMISKYKSVVILRGGRSVRGSRAAQSHVGALASPGKLFDDVLRFSGVYIADSLRSFIASLEAYERLDRSDYKKDVVIVTNTGGLGVLTVDSLEDKMISLKEFDEIEMKILREIIPSYMAVGNPIDLSGDAPTKRFKDVIENLLNITRPRLLVIINQPQTYAMDTENFISFINELRNKDPNTNMILLISGGEFAIEFARKIRRLGIAVAEDPEELSSMIQALSMTPIHGEPMISRLENRREKGIKIIEKALKEGRHILYEHETKELLNIYDIDTPKRFFAKDLKDIEKSKDLLRYPVVIKIVSPEIIHKSDVGGISLNIRNYEELIESYRRMLDKLDKYRIEGVLIEEMIEESLDVFVAGMRDKILGPVISFGSGGVLVEFIKDVAFGLHDYSEKEFEYMIRSTKISEILLKGYRKYRPIDISKIISVLAKISKILEDYPEIKEIEINPLRILDEKMIALDARAILN
jgi:acetyltransferase